MVFKRRRGPLWLYVAAVVALVVSFGLMLHFVSERTSNSGEVVARTSQPRGVLTGFDALQESSSESTQGREELPEKAAKPEFPNAAEKEAAERLAEGKRYLKNKQFDQALQSLAQAIQVKPAFPEAYTTGGYALLGKNLPDNARTAFRRAIDIDPGYADAYYGLAFALDALGDLESALGAMRSYLHVTPEKDRLAKKVITARAAIWEIESSLGRGEWGPTRGIPPGLTAADVRRDGAGVGMLRPQTDGTSRVQKRGENQGVVPGAEAKSEKVGGH